MSLSHANVRNTSPEQRAIDKARAINGAQFVTAYGKGEYSVLGSDHATFYRVSVTVKGQYLCNCRAGQEGRCCYHKGSVWLFRVAQRAKADPQPVKPAFNPLPDHLKDPAGCQTCGWSTGHQTGCPAVVGVK